MGAFAVVRDIDHIDQLGEFAGILRASSEPALTDGLLGVWIENTPAGRRALATPAALANGAEAAVGMTVELSGKWAVCVTAQAESHGSLVALLERHAEPGAEGLFVPVYRSDADPRQRDIEWTALAERFPGRVLPLMVQEPSGRLTHHAPTGVEHTYRQSAALAG